MLTLYNFTASYSLSNTTMINILPYNYKPLFKPFDLSNSNQFKSIDCFLICEGSTKL
jgi:hypothetical protein